MLNVLDLFAGIGGFSLGLERTGHYRTVAFCEQDPKCQNVLKKHWPHVPIFDDVRTLTKEHLNERIDVITGGFPCQDISLAGRMSGLGGTKSGLWSEFSRLIKEISPQFVIIENSPVLRSRGLDQILRELDALRYDAEWHCIPANAIGAPHRRDRVWVVAYATGFGNRIPEGQVCTGRNLTEHGAWWASAPEVPRVDDGVPDRLDRHPQLGNAVVCQIPELIGGALADAFA